MMRKGLKLIKFLHIMKKTSLIIFVTFLLIGNTVITSFVSCCETKEVLFLNSDDHPCCVCCSDTVNKTSLTNHWIGETETTIDDCDFCVCIPYINTSDKYFVFINRTISPFYFLPVALTTAFVKKNATTKNHVFFPTLVNQKTESLSTVILLI